MGGGLFQSDKALVLYHLDAAKPHPNHKPPGWMHVSLSGRGRGEDDPLFSDRLERDGWKLKQEWKREYLGPPKWIQTTQAEVRERTSRNRKFTLRLTRFIKRLDYSEEFSVIRRKDADAIVIPRALGPIGIITEGWFFAETGRSLLPDLMTNPV